MNADCDYKAKNPLRGPQPVCIDDRTAAAQRCRNLSSAVDFNPETAEGSVILNITCVASEAADEALHIAKSVLASPYAFSSRFAVGRGGSRIGDFEVPEHTTAIYTVCSMTLNGLLLRHGIHATARFGGIVEIENTQPKRFSAFIGPGPAPIAPLEVFITCSMTSVCQTIACGSGDVLGSFLEIPGGCLPEARKIYEGIKKTGMGGRIMFGMPSQPLLGMPVTIGHAGIVVFRDLNTAAALKEKGINAVVHPAKLLCNYTALT